MALTPEDENRFNSSADELAKVRTQLGNRNISLEVLNELLATIGREIVNIDSMTKEIAQGGEDFTKPQGLLRELQSVRGSINQKMTDTFNSQFPTTPTDAVNPAPVNFSSGSKGASTVTTKSRADSELDRLESEANETENEAREGFEKAHDALEASLDEHDLRSNILNNAISSTEDDDAVDAYMRDAMKSEKKSSSRKMATSLHSEQKPTFKEKFEEVGAKLRMDELDFPDAPVIDPHIIEQTKIICQQSKEELISLAEEVKYPALNIKVEALFAEPPQSKTEKHQDSGQLNQAKQIVDLSNKLVEGANLIQAACTTPALKNPGNDQARQAEKPRRDILKKVIDFKNSIINNILKPFKCFCKALSNISLFKKQIQPVNLELDIQDFNNSRNQMKSPKELHIELEKLNQMAENLKTTRKSMTKSPKTKSIDLKKIDLEILKTTNAIKKCNLNLAVRGSLDRVGKTMTKSHELLQAQNNRHTKPR